MNSVQKQKILIIEDNTDIREIYQMKLKLNNYNVVTAKDGKEGVDLIKKESPDLVLLDILLPKKDGFEVLKEIKDSKDERIKAIPFIMLSNLSNKEDIYETKELGAVDYLIKTKTSPKEIVEKIDEFFS